MLFLMLMTPLVHADNVEKVLNGYDPKVDIISDDFEAGPEELPNKKSCFQRQFFTVSQNMGHRFCIGTQWKEKEMEL